MIWTFPPSLMDCWLFDCGLTQEATVVPLWEYPVSVTCPQPMKWGVLAIALAFERGSKRRREKAEA
jgi:hypothetical protein